MMIANRVLACSALVAAAAVAAPQPAMAQDPWWQGQSLCATSNLSVCASVTVVQSGNQLTVTVLNTGTSGTIFTLGMFYTTPPSWSGTYSLVSATKNGNDVLSQWATGTQSLNTTLDWGVIKGGDASWGVQAGDEVVFVLTFSPGFNIDETTGLAWHSGQLQVSEKCITGAEGEHACTPVDVPPVTMIPEPVTMLLLGTGLAGIGGMGALKRRRRGLDIETA